MKVKIGGEIIDSENEPIMLILSEEEKGLIASMGSAKNFCSYPDNMSLGEVQEFMLIPFETET